MSDRSALKVMETTKRCRDCGEHKPATSENFHANPNGRLALHPYCKPCTAKRSKVSDERRRERRRAEKLGYVPAVVPKGTYERLLATQHGRCAICGSPPTTKRLCIDHDHKTGEIRGLLCSNCNTAIGLLADDRNRVLAAAKYLAPWLRQ